MVALLISLAVGWAVEAGPMTLPEDPRLAPVRARLEETINRTSAAGLPAELVVSKVREGLAKGVDPARIEMAASRLAENLVSAQKMVQAQRGQAPKALVRAVAEAKMAGVDVEAAKPLLAKGRADTAARRAVEVLTELSLRGYPAGHSLGVVREVMSRDAGGLDRVTSALETLRQDQALSHAEAADALSRGLAGSSSLDGAYGRAVAEERRKSNGKGAGTTGGAGAAASGQDGPGKSELAPGHMKTKAMRGQGPKKN